MAFIQIVWVNFGTIPFLSLIKLFLLTMVVNVFINFFLNSYFSNLVNSNKLRKVWLKSSLVSLYKVTPFIFIYLIFLLTVYFSDIYLENYNFKITDYLNSFSDMWDKITIIVPNVLVLYFFLSYVTNYEDLYITKKTKSKSILDKTSVKALGRLAKIIICILFVFNIVQPVFGKTPAGFFALGGVASLGIGLAAREILANFLVE